MNVVLPCTEGALLGVGGPMDTRFIPRDADVLEVEHYINKPNAHEAVGLRVDHLGVTSEHVID